MRTTIHAAQRLGSLTVPLILSNLDGKFWTVECPWVPSLACGDADQRQAIRLAMDAVADEMVRSVNSYLTDEATAALPIRLEPGTYISGGGGAGAKSNATRAAG